jgi:hypothetical protein
MPVQTAVIDVALVAVAAAVSMLIVECWYVSILIFTTCRSDYVHAVLYKPYARFQYVVVNGVH